jgi:nucleotide-binding universal stress UspA family protein
MSTIAAGVDGSDTGWWALHWAADEAERRGDRLVVCRVYPPGHGPGQANGHGQATALIRELADPVLTRTVGRIRARLGGARVELLTPVGDPVAHLLELDADLLVVGAPNDRPLSPLSTARAIASHACGPVVVVRPVRPGGLFAGHVVVGVDGSRPADAALRFAFRYAATHRVPLAAVHVADRDEEGEVWLDDRFAETHLVPPPPGLELLDVAVEPHTRDHPDVPVKRAVYHGAAATALVRSGAGARLLVVGDRGPGTALRLLLGSTSQAVVAHATGPVCVVHGGTPSDTRNLPP